MGIIIMLQGRGWKVSYGQNSRGWWIARKDVHVHWCHWFSSICMKPWLLISRSRMILRVCLSNQILNMSVKQFKGCIARLKPAERILSSQVELEWILGAQGFGGWEPLENLWNPYSLSL
jgi:hypothetical protein